MTRCAAAERGARPAAAEGDPIASGAALPPSTSAAYAVIRLGRWLAVLLCFGVLGACALPRGAAAGQAGAQAVDPATGQANAPPGDGRVYDSAADAFIDAATLARRIAPIRYRLLGEVHDNPAHHRLRADLLRALVAHGKHPAVVFEQFDLPHEAALVRAQAAGADADALATAGALDRRGWRWPLHEPLVAAALALRLPVHAGNLPGDVLTALIRDESGAAVDAAVKERVARAPWSAAQEAGLEGEIREGHCNALPPGLVPRFARAQRLRDAAMAQALLDHATTDGAVLIAGDGHVRRDRGVPVYLPPKASVSVGFVEAEAGEDRGQVAREARAAYDYVWVTAAVSRPDPCAALLRRPVP